MDRTTLKNNAKASLKGKYGDAILLMVMYGLIMGAVGGIFGGIFGATFGGDEETVKAIGELIGAVISCLFIFGIHSYFLKISRNETVDWKELFNKTNLFGAAIVLTILIGIFTTLWTLLLIIPGIIAAISYSQSYFVKLDNPDMEAMEVIKKSKELMNGHKMDYFVLQLSFLGWAILGILTLGILYLWLIPYISLTEANFYNELVKTIK